MADMDLTHWAFVTAIGGERYLGKLADASVDDDSVLLCPCLDMAPAFTVCGVPFPVEQINPRTLERMQAVEFRGLVFPNADIFPPMQTKSNPRTRVRWSSIRMLSDFTETEQKIFATGIAKILASLEQKPEA